MIALAWLRVKTGTGNSMGLEGARGCCGGWLGWAEVVCRSTHVKVISWRQRSNDIQSVKAPKGRPVACETLLVWYNITCLPSCRRKGHWYHVGALVPCPMMVSWYQYIPLLASILFLKFFFFNMDHVLKTLLNFLQECLLVFFLCFDFFGGWATRHVGS